MKQFGKAELMLTILHDFLESRMQGTTTEQRREIEQKCAAEILKQYPSIKKLEVTV